MAVQSRLLLWLGAGQANLSLVELNSFDSVVLVEARKEECVALEQQFKSIPNVQIVHALIDLTTRELNFNRRSLAEFSSIADATGILDLFPSLTTIKVDLVTSSAIGELIESVTAGASEITLVIDLPDLNADLLSAILEHQNLKNMYELILPMPELALFKAAATQADMKYLLNQHGFDVSSQDNTDPDIPYVQFKRNHLWAALNDSKHKLHESESSLASVKIKYDELILENQLHLEQLAANELDLAQKEQQLKELTTKAERELSDIKKAFDTDKSQLESANSQLIAKNAEIKSELENEKSAAVDKIDELQSQLAEMTKQRDQQAHWHQENKKWAEALKSKNEKLETDAAQKQTIIEQFSEQVRLLEAKQVELIESLSNKNSVIAELTEQQKQDQLACGEIQKLVDSLKIDNDSFNADISEKQTLIEQLLSQATVFEIKQDELIQSLSNKDALITELTEQQKQDKLAHVEIQKLADSRKIEIDSLITDVSEKQTLIEQLLTQAAVFEVHQKEASKKYNELQSQLAEVKKQRDEQAHWHQENKKWAESLKVEIESLSDDNSKLNTNTEQLSAELSGLRSKLNELVDSQRDKDAQINNLTNERDEQAHWHQENKKWAESLKVEIESLSDDNSQLQITTEQFSGQLSALQSKINELVDSQRDKDAQINNLTNERDEQTHWHQENRKWAESLKVENETLRTDNSQLQISTEQVSAQLSALQSKINELIDSQKDKDTQINDLTKQRDEQAHWHQENKRWAEGLKKQVEIKDREYSELNEKTVDKEKSQLIAQKLHFKAALDLSDLREKYKIKSQNETQLVELVKELYEKLHEASNFYSRLMLLNPDLNKGLDPDLTYSPPISEEQINLVEDISEALPSVPNSTKKKTRTKNLKKRDKSGE